MAILTFPAVSLGQLSLHQEAGTRAAPTKIGEACGHVEVPEGCELSLTLGDSVDPQSLSTLPPDALVSLTIESRELEPGLPARIAGLPRLKSLCLTEVSLPEADLPVPIPFVPNPR